MDLSGRLTYGVYYSSACAICLRRENITHCGKCGTVAYCCVDHKREDFTNHYPICKALMRAKKQVEKCKDIHLYVQKYYLEVISVLGRMPNENELHMISFPHLCRICLCEDNLYHCPRCKCITYCSKKHEMKGAVDHVLRCEEFKITYLMDIYMKKFSIFRIDFHPERVGNTPVKLRKTLDLVKMISVMHYRESYGSRMPNLTTDELLTCTGIVLTKALAPGLTILNALRWLGIENENVVVHIIRPTAKEAVCPWLVYTDIIRHFIKSIKKINVFMTNINENSIFSKHDTEDCTVKAYTHKYSEIRKLLPSPNLVCVFNKSYHQLWDEELPYALQNAGTGLLCTDVNITALEFNRKQIFTSVPNLKLVLPVHHNNFKELHPMRTQNPMNPQQIFYCYNFAFIARLE